MMIIVHYVGVQILRGCLQFLLAFLHLGFLAFALINEITELSY